MVSKNIYWIILAALLLYIFVLAPRDNAPIKSTGSYIKQLIFGPYGDIEPYIICLFSFMGIWPMIYLTMLLVDGQYKKFNGTLSALLSNVLGALIILPYFALRRSDKAKEHRVNIFVRLFELKITPLLLLIITIGLICFALIYGHFQIFIHEFQRNWFIHCMTIDFFIFSFLFPFLIEDDLKRRRMFNQKQWTFYFRLGFIPLFGPLIYFLQRQPLKQIIQ